MLCVFGCATRDRSPGATPAPPTVAATAAPPTGTPDAQAPDVGSLRVEQAPSSAPDGGAKIVGPVSSPCVLHAGNSHRKTRTVRRPGGQVTAEPERGSCSANAECIANKGHDTAGDGFVRLDCTDRSCRCSIEPSGPSGGKSSTTTFEASSPCTTSARAMQLIVEQCMPGLIVIHP
jgi:hypothetical protein